VPAAFVASVIGGEAIRLGGTPEQAKAYLPRLAGGEIRLAVALPELGAGPTGVTVSGEALTGELPLVEWAHLADRIVVAAGAEGDTSLWLVDPAEAGVTLTRTPVLDGTARTATLTLVGATAERLPAGDAAVVAELVRRATVLVANDLVGIAREALTRTVDYVKTREQFGRVVGSFQALKHHLADLNVEVTMAEHAAWYAAHALDSGLPDAELATSIAKAAASDAGRDATAKMIQYHGGIGYTWEHDAHLFFKRAKRLEFAYGDPTSHREQIAALVVDAL
jgi:alkylation response protein AidB-like acyl-CoA dehydrogenase